MEDEEVLLIRRDGPVLTASFNRPHRKNALLPSSLDLLVGALHLAEGQAAAGHGETSG